MTISFDIPRALSEVNRVLSSYSEHWSQSSVIKSFKSKEYVSLCEFDCPKIDNSNKKVFEIIDEFYNHLDSLKDIKDENERNLLFHFGIFLYLNIKFRQSFYIEVLTSLVPKKGVLVDKRIVKHFLKLSFMETCRSWKIIRLLSIISKIHSPLKIEALNLVRDGTLFTLGEKILKSSDFSEVLCVIMFTSIIFPERKFSTGKPFISKIWNNPKHKYYENFPYKFGNCKTIEYVKRVSEAPDRFGKLYEIQSIKTNDFSCEKMENFRIFCNVDFEQIIIWIFNDTNEEEFSPIEIYLPIIFNINFIDNKILEFEGFIQKKLNILQLNKLFKSLKINSNFSIQIKLVNHSRINDFLNNVRNYEFANNNNDINSNFVLSSPINLDGLNNNEKNQQHQTMVSSVFTNEKNDGNNKELTDLTTNESLIGSKPNSVELKYLPERKKLNRYVNNNESWEIESPSKKRNIFSNHEDGDKRLKVDKLSNDSRVSENDDETTITTTAASPILMAKSRAIRKQYGQRFSKNNKNINNTASIINNEILKDKIVFSPPKKKIEKSINISEMIISDFSKDITENNNEKTKTSTPILKNSNNMEMIISDFSKDTINNENTKTSTPFQKNKFKSFENSDLFKISNDLISEEYKGKITNKLVILNEQLIKNMESIEKAIELKSQTVAKEIAEKLNELNDFVEDLINRSNHEQEELLSLFKNS